MFIDEAEVYWKAGNGGNGCCSFRREKYLPKGGPDGGDGGKGGDIVLECSPHVNDLSEFRYKPQAKAQSGQDGMGSDCYGRGGEDCVLKVPPGTQILDRYTQTLVAEVLKPNTRLVILKGGRGGLGNLHFKSSVNQAPRKATRGQPGEEGRFKLVLKTIADVGLVGFPNAGKSSLIRCLTNAQPKVANYPFTTLHANVGVLTEEDRHLVIADIPGLIEGASQNKGLGYRFLRHIERCQALLMVLDIGSEEHEPWKDFEQLRNELSFYGMGLSEKPFIVIANKSDLSGFEENYKVFTQKFRKLTVLPISCKSGDGLEALRTYLFDHFVPKTEEETEGNGSEAEEALNIPDALDKKDPDACVL